MTDSLFIPLGIAWVEAAEGETIETIAIAWRSNIRRSYNQDVSDGGQSNSTRPAVTALADKACLTIVKNNTSATDKSQW